MVIAGPSKALASPEEAQRAIRPKHDGRVSALRRFFPKRLQVFRQAAYVDVTKVAYPLSFGGLVAVTCRIFGKGPRRFYKISHDERIARLLCDFRMSMAEKGSAPWHIRCR